MPSPVPIPERIVLAFPRLKSLDCALTSSAIARYNCIAHAAGDSRRWWEPLERPMCYWPPGVPMEYTIEAYLAAFATRGYIVCESDTLQAGIEKIALFAANDVPKHAARQLEDGLWTSKLGEWEDVAHPLRSVEGDRYGHVVRFMSRPRSPSQ